VSSNGTASNSTVAKDGTVCVPTFGFNATELSGKLFGSNDDVVPILDLALNLQQKILVPLVLVAAFLIVFGAIFFALTKVMQMKLKDPNTWGSAMKQISIFKPATLVTIWMSVIFGFAAAVASTMAVGALNFIIPVLATNISVTGGKILQTFQYLAFVFGLLFAFGASAFIGDKLEQQEGMIGDQYPTDEKGLDQEYDDSMMPQEGMEGMEGQEGQYPEGEYPEGQYPEGPEGVEGQYGEDQQYGDAQEYAQQEQQYAEGGEYAQDAEQQQYQQQQQQQQQQQYQQ
jgi:Ca2+ regulator and membrane fusion protein Fig1